MGEEAQHLAVEYSLPTACWMRHMDFLASQASKNCYMVPMVIETTLDCGLRESRPT